MFPVCSLVVKVCKQVGIEGGTHDDDLERIRRADDVASPLNSFKRPEEKVSRDVSLVRLIDNDAAVFTVCKEESDRRQRRHVCYQRPVGLPDRQILLLN